MALQFHYLNLRWSWWKERCISNTNSITHFDYILQLRLMERLSSFPLYIRALRQMEIFSIDRVFRKSLKLHTKIRPLVRSFVLEATKDISISSHPRAGSCSLQSPVKQRLLQAPTRQRMIESQPVAPHPPSGELSPIFCKPSSCCRDDDWEAQKVEEIDWWAYEISR